MLLSILLLAAAAQDEARDCPDLTTQSGMTECAYRDFERADATLNAQWTKTRAAMRARDADYDKYRDASDKSEGFAQTLLASQRAWLAFRDASCRLASYEMRGGSAAPMIEYGCRAALTEQRTKQLIELAQGK